MDDSKKRKPALPSSLANVLKFLPLVVFALLVIVFKLDLLLAAPIATFCAAVVYMLFHRSSFEKTFEHGMQAARSIMIVLFILMFANGLAECFMATGVAASLINLALRLGVTARTIAIVALLVTSLLSVATGTSWGTFAACAPIFLWLNHIVGGNVLLTICAVAGGACFGDNIGMISDCTVLSCGLQSVKIIDRLKHQLFWAIGCLLLGCAAFFVASLPLPSTQGDVTAAIAQIPQEAYDNLLVQRPSAVQLLEQVKTGVPIYMAIPLIVVIGLAFKGVHTLLCLGAGMVASLICGLIAGTTNVGAWLTDLLLEGFGSAGSWSVVMMMWVAAFGGIMNAMDAFAPLAKLIARISRNVHQLMGWCGVLCLLGNVALADETAQIATMGPIVRDITEKNVECDTEEDAYQLRVRLATFTSAMGIYGSELIPWHCFPVFFAGIANAVYPLRQFTSIDIIGNNFMSYIVIGSILLLTFTGWDRFIPRFGLPKNVRLKKTVQAAAK